MDKNDRDYTNGEITVFWRPAKCIHATTCYRELIEVFNPRKRPWVNMDGASTEEIIRVVKMCPTQALAFAYNKDLVAEKKEKAKAMVPEDVPEIRVMEDGPLVFRGNFRIVGTDGMELKTMKIQSLCRCGASLNMPFCDGTHRKTGFTSKYPEPETTKKLKYYLNPKTLLEKKPVEVTITKGGPLHVKGLFSFKDSAGQAEIREHELYLCRCGGSSDKPFCDNTHVKIGVKE